MSRTPRRGQRPLPEPQPLLAVCGDTGLKEFGGKIREEFHKKLTGDRWKKIVKEMIYNEPYLSAPYMLIEMMIRSTPREVKLADKGHPQSAEAQEFIASALDDMESTLQEALTEAASAVPWGYAYLEVLYKIRKGENDEPRLNSKHDDGRYGWRDWAPRAQESREEWAFSDEGRLLGMWQRVDHRPQLLFIPVDRAIHFRFRGSKQNPEGFSFFRPAYPSYYYATNKRMTEAISLERDGAGLPVQELPPEMLASTDSTVMAVVAKYESMVRKMRGDTRSGLVVPAQADRDGVTGFKTYLMSAGGKNIGAYDVSIKRDQVGMLLAFLQQFLALGFSDSGSRSLGDSMTSNLGYAVSAVNKAIDERIMRSAFFSLLRLEGFHPDSWPTYKSGDVEKQKLEATGAFVGSMLQAGGMASSDRLNDWAYRQIDEDPPEGPSSDDMIAEAGAVLEQVEAVDDLGPEDEDTAPPELDAEDVTEEEAAGGEMLTVDEAAEELRVPRGSLMRAINAGKLPGAKIGNQFRMRRSDIEAMFSGGAG